MIAKEKHLKEVKAEQDNKELEPEKGMKITKEKAIEKNKKLNTINIPEPVFSNEGKLCWIVKKTEKKSISDLKKPITELIKENLPLIDIITFELKPSSLWKCKRCGAEIEFTNGIPTDCTACNRQSTFQQITKEINPDLWKIPIWKDIKDLDMKTTYKNMLDLIKNLIVFSDEIEYKIYALWIISTWKLESWSTVGFPCFIGLSNSGKSQALRLIHYLGYRAPKASGVTMAAIPRLCHYHNVTLLIDEAHNKLNPENETGAGLLDFIKDSYKRDSIYITCDNNDQEKVIVTKNFGFKAFAGEKTFNTGLLTRGIIFWMMKANPEIAKFEYVEDELKTVQTELLNYRLKTDNTPDLGNDFPLKGRTREIFESIIATAKHIGIPYDDILNYAKERDKKEDEELKASLHGEILSIIKECEEDPSKTDASDRIGLPEILQKLDWDPIKENSQKLGYHLKNMGLTTKKIDRIRYIFLQEPENAKRLKLLYRRYKLVDDSKQKTID